MAAGKTPVGAKIKARLAVATLIDGKVIPRSAVFSGEVIDSAAKTADASRLAIRMDSVVWKKGSASLTAYLTAWYYPLKDAVRICNMGQRTREPDLERPGTIPRSEFKGLQTIPREAIRAMMLPLPTRIPPQLRTAMC